MPDDLLVYVLIGGQSERFGSAKATHPVEGQPWAMHVATRLSADLSKVAVVGKQDLAELFTLRFVADDPRTKGPLAGALGAIEDRLERFGPGGLVLASCDLVRPDPAWLQPLAEAQQGSPSVEASAYRIDDRWQPFPMVAHTCWLERIVGHVAGGGKPSFQALLAASQAAAVPWKGSPASGPPQANTPEELNALLSA